MDVINPYQAPDSPSVAPSNPPADFYEPGLFALTGRIGRLRYLAYSTGGGYLLLVLLWSVSGAVFALGARYLAAGLFGLAGVAFAVYMFRLVVRRLHDLDYSGWFSLLLFVPAVNLILWLMLLLMPGAARANRFGPAPTANSASVVVVALIIPVLMGAGIVAAITLPAYQHYVSRHQAAEVIDAFKSPSSAPTY